MNNFLLKYKFIFYLSNFILIFLYLFPDSLFGCFFYDDCKVQPKITSDFIVSSNHLYAFFILSIKVAVVALSGAFGLTSVETVFTNCPAKSE